MHPTFVFSTERLRRCPPQPVTASGGTLVGIDETLRRDPPRLLAFVSSAKIERIFAPFVALQQLSENFVAGDQLPLHLRHVITAGEQLQLTPRLISFFAAAAGSPSRGSNRRVAATWGTP